MSSWAISSVAEAVGHTPLARLSKLDAAFGGVEIWAKLEFLNPGGSVKDRPALRMLLDAEDDGRLKPGTRILDSTSGNTGIALAMYGAARGYPVSLVMPENASSARKAIISAFGAELIYSDPLEGSDGAIVHAGSLLKAHPDRYFYTDQYNNPSNPLAHELGTAVEIDSALGPRLTHFVTGVGTSGTIIGTGRGLAKLRPEVQIVAVEPDDAFHGLEGLKHIESSIVPGIYDANVLDRTLRIDTEVGWAMAERLALEEGYLVGNSSGASVAGAVAVAQECVDAGQDACIVTVLADHGSRYVERSA